VNRLVVEPRRQADCYHRNEDEGVRRARRRPVPEHDEVEHEHDDRADRDEVAEREPRLDAIGQLERLARDGGSNEEYRCTDRHAKRVDHYRVHRRKAAHDDCRLGKAQSAAEQRKQGKNGYRLAQRRPRHQRDSGQGEKRSHDDGGGTEALLALQHGKQQGRQRHDREQRLPEAGVNPLETEVRQREGAPEVQCAEDQRSGERSSARQGKPHDHDRGEEQQRGEREAQSCSPQWSEFAVAEADPNGIAAREQ
jgi:hypothetical protein